MPGSEEPLHSGNAAGAVMRVGATVRKPWLTGTPSAHRFMAHLRAQEPGVVPEPRGRDARGRQVVEFVPGTPDDLWNILIPAEAPDLLCRNDRAPWNLVTGRHLAFIDWDGAGPSTRLRVFAIDGYGADAGLRAALPRALGKRTQRMNDFLRESHRDDVQPWGPMFTQEHGEHWARAAGIVKDHEILWAEALGA